MTTIEVEISKEMEPHFTKEKYSLKEFLEITYMH